jgi:hypothetical protein
MGNAHLFSTSFDGCNVDYGFLIEFYEDAK